MPETAPNPRTDEIDRRRPSLLLPAAVAVALGLAATLVAIGRPAPWAALAVHAALLAAFAGTGLLWLRLERARRRVARLERREAELAQRNFALAEAASRERALLEARPDIVFRRDPCGRVSFANAAYRRSFGEPGPDGSIAPPQVLEATQPGEPGGETLLATTQGPRWFVLEEQVLPDALGRPVETQTVAQDVTERRRAASENSPQPPPAQPGEGARSRLIAAVTHEVRTPLGGMVGMADLLLDTELTPEQRSYTEAVRGSAGALLGLIDDLLDNASLEAGRLTLHERPFALSSVVQEVCELLGPRAEEKGLALATFVARKLPAELVGDPARLRQILLNLVGNAIKFTARGGVLVEVRPQRGEVEIAVRDTGRGIAGPDQARIFEAFERAAEAPGAGGSGLGLTISHRLVEVMGGSLTLCSRRGRGSTFTVRLPLRAADAAAAPPPPALLGRRFAVVSRARVTRRALALGLRDEGARVATFARPRRLPDALAAGAGADGVFVDLPMLDRLAPVLPAAGVVVLLAPAERDALPDILRRPGTSYLIKPVRRVSLLERIADAPATAPPDAARRPAAGRVLLAEDDAVGALLMRTMLERLGHAVDHAPCGHEALARSADAPDYRLAILDMNMPGLGGAEVAAAIRERERRRGGAARLPILAVSADLSDRAIAAAAAAGIDTLLRKPLASEDLERAIRALAEGRGGGGERCPAPA